LGELNGAAQERVIAAAWQACKEVLVIAEPGTPDGFRRILKARKILLKGGAKVLAPCTSELPCTMPSEEWCHFSQRVQRTRSQKLVKNAKLSFEDEKYCYLVVSKSTRDLPRARVIAPTKSGKAGLEMRVCCDDGQERRILVRHVKQNHLYARYKKIKWGAPIWDDLRNLEYKATRTTLRE
jgi:ribosomal protein RSM22 (predicted rRNA methylase)